MIHKHYINPFDDVWFLAEVWCDGVLIQAMADPMVIYAEGD